MRPRFGLDVGGTKIAAAVVDRDGDVIEQEVVPTAGQGSSVVAQIWALVDEAATRHQLDGVGIAVPGSVEPSTGTVVSAPNIGWSHVDLRALVAPAVPGAASLKVLNDANAAAWAEYRFGGHRTGSSFAVITVGTGIGGGIVVDGKLLVGATGAGAEIGHLPLVPGGEPCSCGSRGCWERYSSGSALRRAARERGFGREDASHRVLATHADDPVARNLLDTVAAHFVDGLELVSAVLDPSTVVLGGGLGTDPAFFDAVHARYARQAITPPRSRPQLARGRLGNLAGAVGAADLAASGRSSREVRRPADIG